jgi:hypothetical protein
MAAAFAETTISLALAASNSLLGRGSLAPAAAWRWRLGQRAGR